MIAVKFDTSVLARKFTRLEKEQIPFATALTLTYTARDMQEAVKRAMPQELDRPTRFTVAGVFIRGATKTKLEAYVFLRDEATKGTAPVKYLAPTVYGGQRRVKRFERALRARGIIGANELAVPAIGAKVDQYGNVPAGTIVQMLSNLGANPSGDNTPIGKHRRRGKRKGKDWFVGTLGDSGQRAIMRRDNARTLSPVFILVDESSVSYEKQFAFFDIATQAFHRTFHKNWKAALAYALRTAK
jgi:hypothetical protein